MATDNDHLDIRDHGHNKETTQESGHYELVHAGHTESTVKHEFTVLRY